MKTRGQFVTFAAITILVGVLAAAQAPEPSARTPQPAPGGPRCRVDGQVRSGGASLPGVSVVVHSGGAGGVPGAPGVLKAATSTDLDGTYTIFFTPNATYHLSADLTGFTGSERDVTLAGPPCDQTVNFQLALAPRAGQPAPAGRGGAPAAGPAGSRFQTLNVQAGANGAAALDAAPVQDADDVARLLPPGFSAQSAAADAIAISGSGDATSLDRGLLNDRQQAIRLGQFDPATGQFAAGFGPPDDPGGGGRGGFGGGRGAGPGGRGGFALAGRGARAQSPYQGSVNYTFGGSVLDTPPYQLRTDVPVTQPQFSRNNFGATFGGPLKIPGLYKDTNRRTNIQFNYTGNQSNNVFDQYATVPTDALRTGDFSSSSVPLIDPATGQPFQGNQIPAGRMDPGSVLLLGFIPSPNLPGASQNYHVSTTSHSSSANISVRLNQNLSKNVVQGGRGGFGGGFGGRGGGGPGGATGRDGRGAPGGRGTNINLTAQLQYRRNENQALNVFPNLGGESLNTSFTAPVTLTVARGRSVHNIFVTVTHSTARSTNEFTNVRNVAGEAGINYPSAASTDPLNWGVPNLTFAGFTGVRGASATLRDDTRVTTSYQWTRPVRKHQLRMGGDFRVDRLSSESNPNALGVFTFTGLHSSADSPLAGTSGADFADFLLGLPQLATLQVGGLTHLRQRSFDGFLEDNWQKTSKLTFNLGLRYDVAMPYVEADGRMANLDVPPDFTAAAPVVAGGVGPYSGPFPEGLLDTDANNVGPRIGAAYRLAPGTILRGGYGITYNSGSYASIARQLVAQPPFAETETVIGTDDAPLTLADALLSSTSATTNNFGVDRSYVLGMIQTWNASISRDFRKNWTIAAGYTGTKGTDLDILRAPNRGPAGPLIPDVSAFTWESSGGHSILNAANFQIRRKLAGGFSGAASYTLAKSMDNASSLGAGAPVVAQNDHDLASEWALSSFDRRQQFSGDFMVELPFGPNRRWLTNGGVVAAIAGGWTATLNATLQSGTPFTARVVGDSGDVARGTNGSLRADYSGAPVQLANPMIDAFFNAAAFTLPPEGQFGDSARNLIIGPGARQLNGVLTRDIRTGGNRVITIQVNATNLLNSVQWASIDTNVNSPTFGEVLSVRPMRSVTLNIRFRY